MDLITYLVKYAFIDFARFSVVVLYRLIRRITQELGIFAIFKSFFKPLFGISGFMNRVMGVFVRILLLFLSLLALCFALIFFFAIYVIFIGLPIYLLITGYYTATLAIFTWVTLWKAYEYHTKPIKKITNFQNGNDYYLAGNLKLRKLFNDIATDRIDFALNQFDKTLEVKSFLSLLELPYAETITFIKENLSAMTPQKYLAEIIAINSEVKQNTITIELLFGTLLSSAPNIEAFLSKYSIEKSSIKNSLIYLDNLSKRDAHIWEQDYQIPPAAGVDKGWAISPSFTLNKNGEDFTSQALKGYMPRLIGREDVKNQIVGVLSKKSKNNVVILGRTGTGKSTFVKALAREIALGTNIPALQFKRIISINLSEIISNGPAETAKKMNTIVKEVKIAGNIILFIDEIHMLFSFNENSKIMLNVLEKNLSNPSFQLIGATSRADYDKLIAPQEAFANSFETVEMREPTKEETIRILSDVIKATQRGKFFTYPAIDAAYELTKKYIYDKYFPDKAIQLILSTAASATSNFINKEAVALNISTKLKIPVASLKQDDRQKLLTLETNLKERVIGQDLAVKYVSDALKRGRVGVRNENKPIASFLFYGPTGVGKTETAKAISDIYFGSPDFMIRIDMSEFQTRDSIYRLIGGPGYDVGLLTSQIKTRPYSLVLLDEIEKADKNVFNLFLQVLDDGRLTDSAGNFISFANTLIVMTSNAGTADIISAINQNLPKDEIVAKGVESLKSAYAPEFLNRFTALVPFSPLSQEQIERIAKLKLKDVQNKLLNQHINISFSDNVIRAISQKGYSKEWGVRPLNRAIEEYVETKIANLIINGEVKPGDTYHMETL